MPMATTLTTSTKPINAAKAPKSGGPKRLAASTVKT